MSRALDRGAAPRWRELFADGLARTTVGLLLMETLVAIQVLVTVAVLPAVVSELGGIRLYGVALSASQLATVVVLPFTSRLVGRWGLRVVFWTSIGTFVAGSVLGVVAPDTLTFVGGRLLQGAGSGALYALLLTIFTRRYPPRLRPRMFAAWAIAWAVPGLLGPAYGGFVASTLGWRWAFALILPLLVPAALMLRADVKEPEPSRDHSEPRVDPAGTAVLLAFGVGMMLLLTSLAVGGKWGLLVSVPGIVLALGALRSILPAGSFSAKPGLPAVIASAFLVNASFFAVEGFLPAYLTGVRGTPLTVADLVVSCGVLAWVLGTWIQSRLAGAWSPRRVATVGEVLLLAGVGGVLIGMLGAPLVLLYVSWGVAGLGMGMAYPAITLLATEYAVAGSEVVTLAQYQVAEVLGSAVGPGLVGAALGVTLARGFDLNDGLLVGFTATCLVLVCGLAASPRLGSPSAHGPRP